MQPYPIFQIDHHLRNTLKLRGCLLIGHIAVVDIPVHELAVIIHDADDIFWAFVNDVLEYLVHAVNQGVFDTPDSLNAGGAVLASSLFRTT